MCGLSPAQLSTLRRMGSGDEVWTTGGGNPSAFWHGNLRDRAPGFPTLLQLRKQHLIENYDHDVGSGCKYRITDAGRAALSSHKGQTSSNVGEK